MSRSERRKGVDGERELVTYLRERGVTAGRVPLSGSMDGYAGDLRVQLPCGEAQWEVKRRRGFTSIYRWLTGNRVLAFRGDRQEWLVCMRLDDLLHELHAASIQPPNEPRTVAGGQ